VLLVEVAGDLTLMPAALGVGVSTPRTADRSYYISPPSGVVSLPASFTVELPGTIVGPVTVTVTAFDPLGIILGFGMATRQNLDVGGQTILVVTLVSNGSVVPEPDAGQGGVDAQPTPDARMAEDAHADGPRDAARMEDARDGGADSRGDGGGQ
jgi:hypothetical protein